MEDEIEAAIDQALDGKPRASDLEQMIAALEVRRDTFLRERDAVLEEAAKREWSQRLKEVEKQIKILREEMTITEFVENSVRVTVYKAMGDE